MEYTKLTSKQRKIVDYLGLYDAEIKMITAFDTNGWPLDAENNKIIGDWGVMGYDSECCDIVYEPTDFNFNLYKEIKDYEDVEIEDLEKKTDIWEGFKGYQKKECHTGTIEVFESGGVHVYGGGSTRGATYWRGMIVLDLADRIDEPVRFINVDMPEAALEIDIGVVKIDWRDYSVPELSRGFWLGMVSALKRICNEKGGNLNVLVCCMGGHGRTGTALAILASLFGVVPDDVCPVKYVRDHYCCEAVESVSQFKYIEEITGRKTLTEIKETTYVWKKEEKK